MPGGFSSPPGRLSAPGTIYARRCKYCGSELETRMVPAFHDDGKTVLAKARNLTTCPRCDAPSPPLTRGVGPGGDEDA